MNTLDRFRLRGKHALITGAGRGIGQAIAIALAEAGAQVSLIARTEKEVGAVASDIESRGGRASAHALDICDKDAVAEFFDEAPIFDVLVNNAGMNRPAPLADTDDATIEAVYSLNVLATYRVTREVSRRMVAARRGGSIINVSSQMGHVGARDRTVYCGSKHAVEGFTKALAWELGPHGIRVNTLCPTFIETEMTAPMLAEPQFHDSVVSRIALRRIGRLDEVMAPAVFLASDASSLVTGSALMIDGGWTAQ